MIIERIKVAGLGPIRKPFDATFVRENCIIGLNGCGKTTLFRAMAGVAGTDDATRLIADQEVDYFYLRVRQGRTTHVYETTGRFDLKGIEHFKSKLPHRVSFPLTEWTDTFVSETVDPIMGRDRFTRFVAAHGGRRASVKELAAYSARDRSVQFLAGDGYTTAFWLLMNDTPKGVPLLLDNPSRHLDIEAKRMVIDLLTNNDRQLFYITHSPEMILHDAWQGKNPQQKIVEITQKEKIKKKTS